MHFLLLCRANLRQAFSMSRTTFAKRACIKFEYVSKPDYWYWASAYVAPCVRGKIIFVCFSAQNVSIIYITIDLMHWRHKGSHLHNNDASLVSRSAHVLCWQCALALSLSVRGPGRASPAVWLAGFAPLAACFVWPPTQLGALLWRHMHMVYTL